MLLLGYINCFDLSLLHICSLPEKQKTKKRSSILRTNCNEKWILYNDVKCKILWNKEYEQLQTYQKLTILATLKDDFNMAVCDSLLKKKKKVTKLFHFLNKLWLAIKSSAFHHMSLLKLILYNMKWRHCEVSEINNYKHIKGWSLANKVDTLNIAWFERTFFQKIG